MRLFAITRTFVVCLIFNTSAFGQFFSVADSLLQPSPLWTGDTAHMNFTTEGLRTNAPAAGSLYWVRPSRAAIQAQWDLKITLEFNPSSANFCEFRFLQNPQGHYAVRLSGNSTDDLSLLLRTAEKDTVLAALPGYLNTSKPALDLHILRDSTYAFYLYDADSLLFSTTDSTLRNSRELALFCAFTASRVDKFLFSTLRAEGHLFRDTLAPKLLGIDILDPYTLRYRWNEPCVPAPGALNAIVCAEDTAYYPHLDEYAWTARFSRPLPLGDLSTYITAAVDSAHNLALPPARTISMLYPPSRSVQITAVHPFDLPTPYFLALQSPQALQNLELTILEPDGDLRTYTIDQIDTLSILSAEPLPGALWVPGLKLPREAVLILRHQGIPLCVQPYFDRFEDHQREGNHLLYTMAPNYTFEGWEVGRVSLWAHQYRSPELPPANAITTTYAHPTGELLAQFQHPIYPYLNLPSDTLERDLHLKAGATWDPLRPFVLALDRSWEGLDTAIAYERPVAPDSTVLKLNEVHHSPEGLEEFVELASMEQWVRLEDLMLRSFTPEGAALESGALELAPPEFCHQCVHVPALPPGRFLAVDPPFSLKADSTMLGLYTAEEDRVDKVLYWPFDQGQEHQSFERVSLQSSGGNVLNWGAHVARWCCPSEASPSAPNSIAGVVAAKEVAVHLEPAYLSFDPGAYVPVMHLYLEAMGGSVVDVDVLNMQGQWVVNLVQDAVLGGEDVLLVDSGLWGIVLPKTGLYYLKIRLDGPDGRQQKIVPFSIYNP